MIKSTFEQELDRSGRLIYYCVGDSMMPMLRQKKDLMIINKKPSGRCRKYDVVLYRRDTGQYVMHRILKVRKHDYVICGDNRYRREYGITDRHIIGVLSGFIRNGKTHSVNEKSYKLYVHLYCDFFYVRALILLTKHFLHKLRNKILKQDIYKSIHKKDDAFFR